VVDVGDDGEVADPALVHRIIVAAS
jgi:hypothetical protein